MLKSGHPFCCLCGGSKATETTEHAPPTIMFWDKQRSKGLEVPACERCNNGSSQLDQLAAFFAIAQSPEFYSSGSDEKRTKFFEKITKGCINNIPDFRKLFIDAGEITIDIDGKLEKHSKLKFQDELFNKYLNPWAAKQALAHWYDTHETIFSENGMVIVRWLTNHELITNPELEPFVSRFGEVSELVQGLKNNNDQFYIRYPETKFEDNIHAMFAAYHGTAFMAALIDNKEILERLGPRPLGNHSAAFMTSAKNGIYSVDD